MVSQESKSKKIYYSMGEVAEMFDVNTTLIRFWESKFDILKPHRNKKGNRLFTPADVENLKLIYHLVKEKGMTLAGAQKRLKENREGINRDMEIIDRLQNIRAMLMEIKQEMKGGDSDDEIEIIVSDDLSVDYDASSGEDSVEEERVAVAAAGDAEEEGDAPCGPETETGAGPEAETEAEAGLGEADELDGEPGADDEEMVFDLGPMAELVAEIVSEPIREYIPGPSVDEDTDPWTPENEEEVSVTVDIYTEEPNAAETSDEGDAPCGPEQEAVENEINEREIMAGHIPEAEHESPFDSGQEVAREYEASAAEWIPSDVLSELDESELEVEFTATDVPAEPGDTGFEAAPAVPGDLFGSEGTPAASPDSTKDDRDYEVRRPQAVEQTLF